MDGGCAGRPLPRSLRSAAHKDILPRGDNRLSSDDAGLEADPPPPPPRATVRRKLVERVTDDGPARRTFDDMDRTTMPSTIESALAVQAGPPRTERFPTAERN